jgi:hypothetical protein
MFRGEAGRLLASTDRGEKRKACVGEEERVPFGVRARDEDGDGASE